MKVAILDTGYKSYAYEKDLLGKHGYTLQIFEGNKVDSASKAAFAEDAVGIFIRWTHINEEFLKQCPNLKAIVRYGVGYENIDLAAVKKRGIKAANVSGYGNNSVSDHALALMYACARGLFEGHRTLSSNFGKPPFERIIEFHHKTLGIIGLGRIGGTLATKAVHLFKSVIATDPYIEDARFDKFGVKKVSLDELLRVSNVISIHCNLTPETTHMLNRPAFDMMHHNPVLINTARGPVIETKALPEALDAGKIHSAGLDVFDSELSHEIPEDLVNHPKIISTGHYAWYSEESMRRLQEKAAGHMLDLLEEREVGDLLC